MTTTPTGVRTFDQSLETTREMPGGVLEDVRRILPEPIRDLWP
jgi:hypothetical protein